MAELERRRVANAQAAEAAPRFPRWVRTKSARADLSMRREQAWCLRLHCDVVQPAGRPAVTRSMLVRVQPSQPSRPDRLAGRGCRSLKPATRVRVPLGASRSRTRLGMRPGCRPGEAGSIPVESASRRRSVDEHRAPTAAHGGSTPPRRSCVARLVASPRAVNPWSRVRFPGDAPTCDDRPVRQAPALMRRESVVRLHGRRPSGRRFGRVRSSGCRGAGHPAGFGPRRSQVRVLPARSRFTHRAVEERPSSRAS